MANPSTQYKPFYLKAAERLAADMGKNVDDLLAEYRESVRNSQYPGPECLEPSEVEQFINKEMIPEARLAHTKECLPCAVLLEAAIPNDAKLEEFLSVLKGSRFPVEPVNIPQAVTADTVLTQTHEALTAATSRPSGDPPVRIGKAVRLWRSAPGKISQSVDRLISRIIAR